MSTTLAALLVLILVFAVRGENTASEQGYVQCSLYSNGCSTPFNMDVWYKKAFTPACDIHDVCYRCGARYGISRDRCDSVFLSQMQSVCPRQQKPDFCRNVSTLYYKAVKNFGLFHYRLLWFTPKECSNRGIRTYCLKNH